MRTAVVRAVTRGDGPVTGPANIRTIKYPIEGKLQRSFEVRGEVYMTFQAFSKLNESMVENGLKPMQNPRNTTPVPEAGTCEVARRNLSLQLILIDQQQFSHFENLRFLSEQGFPL